MKQKNKLLLVGDNFDQNELIRCAFAAYTETYNLIICSSYEEGIKNTNSVSLVILKWNIDQKSAVSFLQNFKDEVPFPVIVFHSESDEKAVVDSIKSGALDFFILDDREIVDMPFRVEKIMSEWEGILKRKIYERQIIFLKEKYREIFENIQDVYFETSLEGVILEISPSVYNYFKINRSKAIGRNFAAFFSNKNSPSLFINELINLNSIKDFEVMLSNFDGTEVACSITAKIIYDTNKEPLKIVGIVRDITERKRLEEQLVVSQKMEAVGKLAGSIAHDFNNILTVISGYANMVMLKIDEKDPIHKSIDGIQKAAARANNLIQHLLTFSKKNKTQPVTCCVNRILDDMSTMIEQLKKGKTDITIKLQNDIDSIFIDPVQIEQIILNLIVNAIDATEPEGGLRISTKNIHITRLDNQELKYFFLTENIKRDQDYVRLSVADNGKGIPCEVLPHIFEPFFSTKKAGKGTGLGLATVYGIVNQFNGFIEVKTSETSGTDFSVFFPSVSAEGVRVQQIKQKDEVKLKVLIVDDDENLRVLLGDILIEFGYRYEAASNTPEALKIFLEKPEDYNLVITDIHMPGINGIELSKSLKEYNTEIKILFISGYASEEIIYKEIIEKKMPFLKKPFTALELGLKIHEIIH